MEELGGSVQLASRWIAVGLDMRLRPGSVPRTRCDTFLTVLYRALEMALTLE
jgi:hypothetical protein